MPRISKKTSVLTVRVAPEVKAALQDAADTERRSLANMLEVAVLAYCGKPVSPRKLERRVRREE